jgi:hypothetical protein
VTVVSHCHFFQVPLLTENIKFHAYSRIRFSGANRFKLPDFEIYVMPVSLEPSMVMNLSYHIFSFHIFFHVSSRKINDMVIQHVYTSVCRLLTRRSEWLDATNRDFLYVT